MARPNKPGTTNRHSAEFKLKAVKLTQINGVQVKDVAEALGFASRRSAAQSLAGCSFGRRETHLANATAQIAISRGATGRAGR